MFFDPSKMDPKSLMELSRLFQELPPEQLSRMQTMMHNMMAGFDVSKEMEAFERSLPPGFREKIMGLMVSQAQQPPSPVQQPAHSTAASDTEMNLHQARITILRAVAGGKMSPEEAERLLFPG